MGILVTFGWIAFIIGVVLILLGYTVAAHALRPGWAALILGVVLLLVGYLLPVAVHPHDEYVDTPTAVNG